MKKLIKMWHSGRDFHDADAEITSYKGVLSYRRLAVAFCYKSEVTGRRHIIATPEGIERVGLNRKITRTNYGNLVALINYHLEGRSSEMDKALTYMSSPPVKLSGILLHQHANLPHTMIDRANRLLADALLDKRFLIISSTKLDREMRARCVLNSMTQHPAWMQAKNDTMHWYTCDDPEEVSLITLMSMDAIVVDTHKVKEAWS